MKKTKAFKKVFSVILSVMIVATCCVTPAMGSSSVNLNVSLSDVSHEVSETLYGAFIEDISKAGDGGLVSNLIYNNSFEYNDTDEENADLNEAYWVFDNVEHTIATEDSMNENNPTYEVLTIDGTGTVSNLGCVEDWDYKTWNPNSELQSTADMGFEEGVGYDFSVYFKNIDFEGTVTVYIDSESNSGTVYTLDISNCDADWYQVTAELTSAATEDGGFAIQFDGTGTIQMDFAQLIPQNSYGYDSDEWQFTTLRADLVEALADLSPSFIRFPGGCFAEGDSLDTLYDWKSTIGPLEERVQTYNVWRNDDAGDYYINSNQMGYMEYFNLCDDLGAEPVPCLNVGLTCQGRNSYDINVDAYEKLSMTDEEFEEYLVEVRGYSEDDTDGIASRVEEVEALGYTSEDDWEAYCETIALTPGTDEWDEYVQDILDLIEFANGDAETTYWGALRAAYGHEEPYGLDYIQIGNENWGEVFWRNFDALYEAIKEAYPDIQIITTAGTWLSGNDFDYAWETISENYADTYVDEHYYTSGSYMYEINDRYDSYDRDSAKVFVGEYAATADGVGTIQTKANMSEALEEAAYMTGFERNSDVVAMTSYAPTFAKINSQNWAVNEIWFDSQDVILTPTYYVQMLYSNNIGTEYIDASFDEDIDVSDLAQSVTVDQEEQVIYIKLVNSSTSSTTVNINLDGFDSLNLASNQSISSYFISACNERDSEGASNCVVPTEEEVEINGSTVTVEAERYSVNVIRIAYGDNDGSNLYTLPDSVPTETSLYLPPALKVAIPCVAAAIVVAIVAAIIISKVVKKKKAKKAAEIVDM